MSVEAGLLRETREYLGLSLEYAALEAGITPELLAEIEGPGSQPDELRLHRIANVYEVSAAFFEQAPDDSRNDDLVAIGRLAGELSGVDLDEAIFFAHLLRFAEE
jgi:transcriptional regulator with XRE-family HTH domain